MEEMKQDFPPDMDYVVSLDTTLAIEEGIAEIISSLYMAVGLVILVVFIFLQNARATLIPSLAVPVSLIGTFMVFPLLGFSINTLSLLGLVLAIGIVVDDAIVVVEAVTAKDGEGRHDAAPGHRRRHEGSLRPHRRHQPVADRRVRAGGRHGRHHRPALSAVRHHHRHLGGHLVAERADPEPGAVRHAAEAAGRAEEELPAAVLRPVQSGIRCRHRSKYMGITGFFTRRLMISVAGLVGLTIAMGGLFGTVPGGFVPEEDQGYFLINVQLPDAASLERTDAGGEQHRRHAGRRGRRGVS